MFVSHKKLIITRVKQVLWLWGTHMYINQLLDSSTACREEPSTEQRYTANSTQQEIAHVGGGQAPWDIKSEWLHIKVIVNTQILHFNNHSTHWGKAVILFGKCSLLIYLL